MCPTHWFEVPGEVRIEVSRALNAWLGGKENLRPYMAARLTALICVGKLHRIDMSALEAKLDQVREDLRAEQAKG
jgi:hypothetical protein